MIRLLSIAVAAAAAVIAYAYRIAIAAVRVRDDIGWDGTVAAKSANELCRLGLTGRVDEGVLVRLRGREFEGLVFRLERRDLVLRKEIEDRAGSRVLAVDDVAGVSAHGILQIRKLCGHVVIDTVDCPLRGAAAGGKIVAQIAEAVCNAIKAVAKAALDAANSVLEVVKLETCVDVRACRHALQAVAAEAEAAAHAAPAEEGRHDDQAEKTAPTAAAEHVIIVAAGVVLTHEIAGKKFVIH